MKICTCWQIKVTTTEQKKWQWKPNVGGKDMGKTEFPQLPTNRGIKILFRNEFYS